MATQTVQLPDRTATNLSASDREQISTHLQQARLNHRATDPPKMTWPALTVDDAFEVQRITVERAISQGDRLVGVKLGNIAKVMQAAFGLDQPDYGFLLSSTFHFEGTKVELAHYIQPFVELEPAFVLKAPLKGPNLTAADVIAAVEYVVPAIEIIDSRVKNWNIGLEDTLSDNGSTGAVIIGGQPRRLEQLNLSNTKGSLSLNGKEVMTGNTKNILGNPINAVAWLLNKLARYDVSVKAGDVVLPGSCLQAMPMDRPGTWSCSYEGWGTIEFEVV